MFAESTSDFAKQKRVLIGHTERRNSEIAPNNHAAKVRIRVP